MIAYKPVDVWTSLYIIQLLVCLFSEVSKHLNMRFASLCVIVFVLVARYALVLCLNRNFFNLDLHWAVWLGLQPEPALYPSMSFSTYFLYDFIIVLVSFFYQRHVVTSSRFSCVASDNKDAQSRHSMLVEYAKFAVRILYSSDSAGIDARRFSFFGIYRQFCLNYDRISAFAGLFVLLYTTVDSYPSLPNMVITLVLTLTLIQFETKAQKQQEHKDLKKTAKTQQQRKDLIKRELLPSIALLPKSTLYVQGACGYGSMSSLYSLCSCSSLCNHRLTIALRALGGSLRY